MNIRTRFLCTLLISLFATNTFATGRLKIAEALLRIMTKNVEVAKTALPNEVRLLEKTPAFIYAAEHLARNSPESEMKRVSELLEKVILREYKNHGLSLSMLETCKACVPQRFADDINGRAMDVIRKRDDLLVKVSSQQNQIIRLVDRDGNQLSSQAEYRQVLDEMVKIFSPSISAAKEEQTGKGFSSKFIEALKANGSVEIEYDAKGDTFTASFKYGAGKAKVANVDVGKILSNAKYLLVGGGLASLGYKGENKKNEPKEALPISKIESKRLELLQRLTPAEKTDLFDAADAEYFVLKVRQTKTIKNNALQVEKKR